MAAPTAWGDRVYVSTAVVKDRIYLTGQNGAEFELMATNVLDEEFNASPAVAENEIYLRGRQFLYRILEE